MELRITTIFIFCAAIAACSGSPKDGDAWKLGNDTGQEDVGADVGTTDGGTTDGGSDDVGPGPSGVTFRLVNGQGAPVFAYGAVAGGLSCSAGAWLEVSDGGAAQRISSDCSRCSCDDEFCAICAFDCAPGSDPRSAQLRAGEARTFEWDGLFRVDETSPQGTCEALQPPSSDRLSARFCWGYRFETTFEPWGEIAEVECADVEFSIGDEVVEYTIPPTARDGVTFRLTNTTAEMRYADLTGDSICNYGSWVELSQEGAPLRIVNECGTCSCTEVTNGSMCPSPCPGVACAAPTAELFELPPGGERTFTWNRSAYFDDSVDGTQCRADRLVTGLVTARLCWGTSFDDAGFQIADRTCEVVEFDPYLVAEVSHDIIP